MATNISQAAFEYGQLGLQVVPLYRAYNGACECSKGAACGRSAGKHPRIDKWQEHATSNEDTIAGWVDQWPAMNIGVQLGEASGILDMEADSEEAEVLAHKLFGGEVPYTPTYQSKRGKHRLFRWRPDLPKPDKAGFKIGELEFRTGNGAKGQQSVFPPSTRADGSVYEWIITFDDANPAPIDDVTLDRIREALGERPRSKATKQKTTSSNRSKLFTPEGQPEGNRDNAMRDQARSRWGDLRRSRGEKVLDDEAVFEEVLTELLALNATQVHPPLDEVTIRRQCETARECERREMAERVPFTLEPAGDEESGDRWTDIGHEEGRTVSAFGRRFLRSYSELVRYVPEWDEWLFWDGDHWRRDIGKCSVMRLCQAVSDSVFHEAMDCRGKEPLDYAVDMATPSKWRTALTAAGPYVAVRVSELDANPYLFNTPSGTIDLRTGELRQHNRADLLTKLCPTPYEETAGCPRWLQFLDDVFESRELTAYLQRYFGWCLTGLIREHVLHLAYGVGANGKSTLFNTMLSVMGRDYAMQAVSDLLVERKGDSHPTERADLFGMRLVVATETEGNARLAESLVKQLTGGDRIRARRMRQDFWEFEPSHKLVLLTNHKPRIKGQDHGIWRRLRLLPFNAIFGPDRADKTLPEKLLAEAPGILAWAVAGAVEWLEVGLQPPQAVLEATNEYKGSQDTVGKFIDECCVVGETYTVKFPDLRQAFEAWATENGENMVSAKALGQYLIDRGCQPYQSSGRRYRGIGLQA